MVFPCCNNPDPSRPTSLGPVSERRSDCFANPGGPCPNGGRSVWPKSGLPCPNRAPTSIQAFGGPLVGWPASGEAQTKFPLPCLYLQILTGNVHSCHL